MKKYTITVTSKEHATIEVIAKDDEDALKKAYEFDIDDCDWIGAGFDYEIDDAETVEYTEKDAMNDVLRLINKGGYIILNMADGKYMTTSVKGRTLWLGLPKYITAADLVRAVVDAYKNFDAGREALSHIKEMEETMASSSELMSILTAYNVEKDNLFRVVEELENLFMEVDL